MQLEKYMKPRENTMKDKQQHYLRVYDNNCMEKYRFESKGRKKVCI